MVAPPPHDDAAPSPVSPVAAGLQAGLTASQLRGPRFDAPLHGLRHPAGGQPSLADVVRALQRTNPGTAATHATAARLWGMWLPRQWERGPVHLARTRTELQAAYDGRHRELTALQDSLGRMLKSVPRDKWTLAMNRGYAKFSEETIARGNHLLEGNPARRQAKSNSNKYS